MAAEKKTVCEYTPVEDVAGIVAEARKAFRSNRTRRISWRRQQLEQLAKLVLENKDALLDAVAKDLSKPRQEAYLAELGMVLNDLDMALSDLDEWVAPEKVSTKLVNAMDGAQVRKDPLGVVLIIGAWNFPFQLTLQVLVGALAAGNCAVIKPSEVSAHSAAILAELIPKYMDQEAIKVINGAVPETTAVLAQRFDHILYTGNGMVGRIVMQAAAKHLTPVTLELGGKSPTIVDRDVDVKVAARRIAWGRFMNAGQICIAPDYILCHPAVHDELVRELQAAVREFYGEDPKNSKDYARIVNERHVARVKSLLDGAKEAGAKVAFGGQVDQKDCYIAPTVLTGVDAESAVMKDEIFGPLLPVLTVADADAAVKFVNDREKPLALYIFSNSKDFANKILNNTSSGSAVVNDTIMQASVDTLSFGGVGASGMGGYHGRHTFDTFTHRKSMLFKNLGGEMLNGIRYPPYSAKKLDWISWLLVPTQPGKKSKILGFIKLSGVFLLGAVAAIAINSRLGYVDASGVPILSSL